MADRWIVNAPPSERFPLYTRANVGEVFADPVPPLTFTLAMFEVGEMGFRDAYVKLGVFDHDEFTDGAFEHLGFFDGYCYLNAAVGRVFGFRTPGLTPEAIDAQYYGDQPGIPPYEQADWHDSPEHTARVQEMLGWILTTPDLPDVAALEVESLELRASRPDLASMDSRAIDARNRGLVDDYRRFFGEHIFVSMAVTVPMGIITGTCEALGRPEDALRLISAVGDVASAGPALALWDLSRQVAMSKDLTRAFDGGVGGLLGRLSDAGRDGEVFRREFDDFLFRFGSRGINEWEPMVDAWENDPTQPLAAVDRMRHSPDSAAPAARAKDRAREREALAAELIPMLDGDPEAQGQFVAALGSAGRFVAARERMKTSVIRLTHEMRMGNREIARRWIDAGALDDPANLSMLVVDELDDAMADPGAFAGVMQERRETFEWLRSRQEPFVVVGAPPPVDEWPAAGADGASALGAGESLPGFAGCPGTARGTARIVLDPRDPGDFAAGDVLVAPHTDPSWTPLFVPAAAVVVDVGAALSHAVIVSRELGIPCVVSATGATSAIPDGATVEVDGTRGVVTVVDVPA